MSSDRIVERLRREADAQRREPSFPDQGVWEGSADLLDEAADKIERLYRLLDIAADAQRTLLDCPEGQGDD